MFGLGGWEIAVLGLAALIFFGPHKLPQLMKQAGKIMREVRKASYEFQNSLERELEDDPYRKAHRREKKLKKKADELGMSVEELEAQLRADKQVATPPAPTGGATPTVAETPGAALPPNGNGAAGDATSPMPAASDVKAESDPKPGAG